MVKQAPNARATAPHRDSVTGDLRQVKEDTTDGLHWVRLAEDPVDAKPVTLAARRRVHTGPRSPVATVREVR